MKKFINLQVQQLEFESEVTFVHLDTSFTFVFLDTFIFFCVASIVFCTFFLDFDFFLEEDF